MSVAKGTSIRNGHRELHAEKAADLIERGMEIQALAMRVEQRIYNPSPEVDSILEHAEQITELLLKELRAVRRMQEEAREITASITEARFVPGEAS